MREQLLRNQIFSVVFGVHFLTVFFPSHAESHPAEEGNLAAGSREIGPIPEAQEVIFIGLSGQHIERWVGCDIERLGDLRVDCSPQYNKEARTFPAESVSEVLNKTRAMGGDLVSFFRSGSNSLEFIVYRRLNPDCQPILLYYSWDSISKDPTCPFESIGPLIETPRDGSDILSQIGGAFVDSVRARGGEALLVSGTDSLLRGEVLRFTDSSCSEWSIEK